MSTVYLNTNFKPNNQASFYRNDLYEYIDRQEQTSELILEKLDRQNTFIFDQYNELLCLLSASNEHFLTLKDDHGKLLKSVQSISRVAKSNQYKMQRSLELSENNHQELKDVKEKVDEMNIKVERIPLNFKRQIVNLKEKITAMNQSHGMDLKRILSTTKEAEEKIVKSLSSEMTTLEGKLLDEISTNEEKFIEMAANEKKILEEMTANFKESQEKVIHNMITKLEGVTKNFENYLLEVAKQPICELFASLDPGTKINKIIISGSIINTSTFINYEQSTQQVTLMINDGNLLVANCGDIEAVELNTQKLAP